MKRVLAAVLTVMMCSFLMPVFATDDTDEAVSAITYRLPDEMYNAGVRFYGTDKQEKRVVVESDEPFRITGFVSLQYDKNKLNGVNWKSLTEVEGYKLKNNEKTNVTIGKNQAVSALDENNVDKSLIYDVYFEVGTEIQLEASCGLFPGGEEVSVETVIPKRMSVRLEDGTILKNGDSFTMKEGGTVRFQMCTNNWDTDRYTDDGEGIAGTKVYTFTHVKGKENVLRVDTNSYFMAYRFHFKNGDYNKQTGIGKVLSVPLESLSVNLPLGSIITVSAYQNETAQLENADIFIETAEDKTLSYTDYFWNH